MDDFAIEVTGTPAADELERIGRNLSDFNDADAGPANRLPLAVLVHLQGDIIAGLSGHTAWGWLYVQWLWIGEDYRGRGLAGRMLAAAETEARARACHAAYIDTFNPQALRVYRKAGYAVFGELPNFPPGRTRSFLHKNLS